MSAKQLTRAEWIRRFGWHKGLSLEEAHAQGKPLGSGFFGVVSEAANDPSMAIKYQRGELASGDPEDLYVSNSLGDQVNLQAYLGNELGLMPAVRVVETVKPGAPESSDHVYIGMDNLADRGYQTLKEIKQDPGITAAEKARLGAEAALASAWAARAGIRTGDVHDSNVMALSGRNAPEADGSRVKLIDPGFYSPINEPRQIIEKQADDIYRGYSAIGLDHMGRSVSLLVDELTMENNLSAAASVIADALSDLAARQEGLTEAAFAANQRLGQKLRMAGDIFKGDAGIGGAGAQVAASSTSPAPEVVWHSYTAPIA